MWRISQTVALCVCRLLKEHCGIDCKVKWPNDIYVGDKKICGILISHSLMGRRIQHTIIGAGININQEQFLSDAPNPVSVYMLTGKRYPLPPLIQILGEKIERAVAALSDSAGDSDLHRQFMQQLWRGDGRYYSFCEPGGTPFQARVIEIEPMGHLLLSLPPEAANRPPQVRRYAFKEVIWL
jgi:BirA family biotin operon repressor/biotin-[acetyl-CoA-carboxylase] ligase